MQSGSSGTPLKRSLAGSSPATFTNLKLNAKWLAHSAFQADPIGFESRQLRQSMPSWWNQADTLRSDRSDASRAGANPAEGTNYVAEGEVDSPRAVTPL
jgi:hypothetical protein